MSHLCRFPVPGRVEGEHSREVKVCLWMSDDVKVMLCSLQNIRKHVSAYTETHRLLQGQCVDAVKDALANLFGFVSGEANTSVIQCQVAVILLAFITYDKFCSPARQTLAASRTNCTGGSDQCILALPGWACICTDKAGLRKARTLLSARGCFNALSKRQAGSSQRLLQGMPGSVPHEQHAAGH